MNKFRPLTAILIGGGAAATFDLVYAILRNGKPTLWVLQLVGTGWLGPAAFDGGVPAGLVGLASHYGTLLVAATIFYFASKHIAMLKSQALLCGALFGVGVYLFMNFVVLPLSAFPFTLTYPPLRLLEGFASHAAFVGIPIALAVRRT